MATMATLKTPNAFERITCRRTNSGGLPHLFRCTSPTLAQHQWSIVVNSIPNVPGTRLQSMQSSISNLNRALYSGQG